MTGREVMELLDSLHEAFGGPYGRVVFDESVSVNNCSVENDRGRLTFMIGVKEPKENLDKLFPMGEAMVPVMMYFHEVYGHIAEMHREEAEQAQVGRTETCMTEEAMFERILGPTGELGLDSM